ncbi:MAG: NAD-dependent epimerase/dehydratase family protein [Spirulinaceae cyanobacterium]
MTLATPPTVIVTGASGHIGYHVAKGLCDRGFTVRLLVRRSNANVQDLVQRGANQYLVDLQQPATYGDLIREADCLFHLAAENTTRLDQAKQVRESTLGLTATVLQTAVEQGVKTIVYTSSVVVLGRSSDPRRLLKESNRTTVCESPYVQGKVEAEQFCEDLIRQQNVDLRRVYPSWVVGPDDLRGTPPHQVIQKFLAQGQTFYFKGGISIAAVETVAEGHINAWLRGQPQATYVLGGENITFRQFFTLLAQLTRQSPPQIFLPKPLIVVASQVLKVLLGPIGKAPPIEPAYARTVVGQYSWYDSRKAIAALGYTIPPAEESLRRAVTGERRRRVGTYTLGRSSLPAAPATDLPPLLITGVPGWLGNRFVDILLNGDRQGKIPPRRPVRLLVEPRNADLLDLPKPFEVFPADIRDPVAVGAALEGIGTVFHLAGAIYPPQIKTLYQVNELGTHNLVDQCIRQGVRRILYMGTDSICGHGNPQQRIFTAQTPDHPYRHYGQSKWRAERYILEKSAEGAIDSTSLRGFWFFGPYAPPRQQDFLDMMGWPRQLVFGNGQNYRSISLVDNTIAAFLQAETEPATYGKWYWIGDVKPDYTVNEIYQTLCEGLGHTYRPLYIPGVVCATLRGIDAVMGKFGRLHPTIHGIGKFNFDIAGEIDAAQRDFDYTPVTSLAEYAQELGQR